MWLVLLLPLIWLRRRATSTATGVNDKPPKPVSRDDGNRDDGNRDDGNRDDGSRDDGSRDDGSRDDDTDDTDDESNSGDTDDESNSDAISCFNDGCTGSGEPDDTGMACCDDCCDAGWTLCDTLSCSNRFLMPANPGHHLVFDGELGYVTTCPDCVAYVLARVARDT